jgi:hypothetical protein
VPLTSGGVTLDQRGYRLLGTFAVVSRTRSCSGLTCSGWSAPVVSAANNVAALTRTDASGPVDLIIGSGFDCGQIDGIGGGCLDYLVRGSAVTTFSSTSLTQGCLSMNYASNDDTFEATAGLSFTLAPLPEVLDDDGVQGGVPELVQNARAIYAATDVGGSGFAEQSNVRFVGKSGLAWSIWRATTHFNSFAGDATTLYLLATDYDGRTALMAQPSNGATGAVLFADYFSSVGPILADDSSVFLDLGPEYGRGSYGEVARVTKDGRTTTWLPGVSGATRLAQDGTLLYYATLAGEIRSVA